MQFPPTLTLPASFAEVALATKAEHKGGGEFRGGKPSDPWGREE